MISIVPLLDDVAYHNYGRFNFKFGCNTGLVEKGPLQQKVTAEYTHLDMHKTPKTHYILKGIFTLGCSKQFK